MKILLRRTWCWILGIILILIVIFSWDAFVAPIPAFESTYNGLIRLAPGIERYTLTSQFFRDQLHLGTGEERSDFLTEGRYDSLLIEIHHSSGYEPSSQVMSEFVKAIQDCCTKSRGISWRMIEHRAGWSESIDTADELTTLMASERTALSSKRQKVLYIYIIDSSPEIISGEDVVGYAAFSDSFAVFDGQIQALGAPSWLAASELYDLQYQNTFLHEFGHLLGLMHNNDYRCVMRYNPDLDTAELAPLITDSPDPIAEAKNIIWPNSYCQEEINEIERLKQLGMAPKL